MNNPIDARFLGHWQESQRRQQARRKYLAHPSLDAESYEASTLDLIAEVFVDEAFVDRRTVQHGLSPKARTAAFMSDDR